MLEFCPVYFYRLECYSALKDQIKSRNSSFILYWIENRVTCLYHCRTCGKRMWSIAQCYCCCLLDLRCQMWAVRRLASRGGPCHWAIAGSTIRWISNGLKLIRRKNEISLCSISKSINARTKRNLHNLNANAWSCFSKQFTPPLPYFCSTMRFELLQALSSLSDASLTGQILFGRF